MTLVLCIVLPSVGVYSGVVIKVLKSEAALGMFSMIGRRGAPTKSPPPTKAQKIISCCNSSVHCSTGPQQNVNDGLLCVSGEGSRGGGVFIY